MNELNAKLGLERFEIVNTDKYLSSELSQPTLFTEVTNTDLPAGDTIFNPYTWQSFRLRTNVSYKTETQAEGILTERKFHGSFRLRYCPVNFQQTIDTQGKFEIYLA